MYLKPFFRLALVAILLITVSSAMAGTTGKIAGRVLDKESKEPLPGVSVQIVGTTTGAATNIQGEFFIINVPPGSHALKASLVGYGPVEIQNVVVSVDLTTDLDFQLSTQTIDMGTITVEAVRPLIEKDVTSSRTTIAPTQITDSAVDGIVNQANLSAGSVLGSFRGGRQDAGEVVYMLDGVNLANPIGSSHRGYDPGDGASTALATTLPNEAIAEAEVLTGGFGAEYPNVQSAVVNVISKDGGSRYSGKIKSKSSPEVIFSQDHVENDVFHVPFFASNDPADTLDDGTRRIAYQDITVQRDKLDDKNRSSFYDMRQHEFSFGGPIPIPSVDLPGKMSFFTSGIYTYRRSMRDFDSYVRNKSIHAKLTYDITSSKKVTVSGLLAEGDRRLWNHNRILSLTWGEPSYYHRSDVDISTNALVDVDTFYTPYHFIYAPGHSESDVEPALVTYWASLFGDPDWTAADVQQYFDDNLGGASYLNWANMPDSLIEGAAQYIESLGWARRYENYNMANSLGDPETRSNEFHVSFTNNLSSKSFYNLSYSRFLTAQEARTKDPWDGHPLGREEFSEARFSPSGGTIVSSQLAVSPMWLTTTLQDDEIVTHTLKGDFTSQVNSSNLIKFGGEFKQYNVFFDYHGFASGGNEYTSYYDRKPIQFGIYTQDKIETEGMIVNVGLRYDYFDPKTVVPFDPSQPLNDGYDNVNDPRYSQTADLEARLKNFVSAKKKQQLSPRVGVSYPITEKDVLHVTYGHYFQLPVFDDLYYNHAYDLRGAFKYIGNPNLSEQKTIAYEAGIEHGFNDYLKLSAVGFYKDIADLVSNRKFRDPTTGGIFWINMNSDFARVKGFEFTFTQRPWNNVSGTISYTYQVARGRASDPEQTFNDDYTNRKPRVEDVPLDWDQPHTAKANLNYRIPRSNGVILGDWGFDVVWTYGSGRPYTGSDNTVPPNLPPLNNKRYPSVWRLDFRLDKGIDLYKGYNVNAFFEVQNVTDRADIDPTITLTAADDVVDLERYELTGDPAGQFGDPGIYTAPRRILLGMQLSF